MRALALDIEVLAHVVDPQQAVNEQRFTAEPADDARGDAEAALAASEVTIELELETPAQLQTALEPHGAVVSWDGDEITAWVSTQGMFSAPRGARRRLRAAEGRRPREVEFVGGGFGAKQGAGFEALAAAELARVPGRPVRLVNDRHAEQLDGGRRGATRQTIRLGASRDGTLTAIEVDAVVAMGQGGWMFPVAQPGPHAVPLRGRPCADVPRKTNLRAQNAFRAPGVMEGVAAFEQAMDELALALGMDPLELRRRNHVDVDQVSGLPYSSKQLLACYDRAAELAGWDRRDELREPQADGLLRGMGCATQIWWGGGGPPSHATVRLDADGHALVDHRDPGHRHGHAHRRADRGCGGARAPARPRARRRRGYGPERLRPGRRRLDDDAVGDARRTLGRGKVRKTLLQLASDVFEIARGRPRACATGASARATARSTPT